LISSRPRVNESQLSVNPAGWFDFNLGWSN
jgi:hypothetical protein